jgi:glycosyltransferase involved in cell wall biosynthesis
MTKDEMIVTAGRLWDQGKNTRLLLAAEMPGQIQIVGAHQHPGSRGDSFTGQAATNVHFLPQQDEQQMAGILARAAIYTAPSRYEPFGLAPLEAALSGCALVASDIPSLRELWEGAAVFFRSNDAGDLRQALELLIGDPCLCRRYAGRAYDHAVRKFNAARMTDEYMELYRTLAPAAVAAA